MNQIIDEKTSQFEKELIETWIKAAEVFGKSFIGPDERSWQIVNHDRFYFATDCRWGRFYWAKRGETRLRCNHGIGFNAVESRADANELEQLSASLLNAIEHLSIKMWEGKGENSIKRLKAVRRAIDI